jgi:hypothetical protein
MSNKDRTTENTSYDVGYGKTPKSTRFRKGQSGHSRGRNRGDENIMSIFKRVVSKRVKVGNGDKSATMTLAEAVIFANYKAALQRNPLAMSNIFRLAEESGEMIDVTDKKQVGQPMAFPKRSASTEEFLAQFGRHPDTE